MSTAINQSLLDRYRLSAYFAANPKATIQDGVTATAFPVGGAGFYRNCVHLRDARAKYHYEPLKDKMDEKEYKRLFTRFDWETQRKIIKLLQKGEKVHAIADALKLHYQHVTVYSIVFRRAYHLTLGYKSSVWVPYCAADFHALAEQLRVHVKEHGRFPAEMQTELVWAIREMFAKGPDDPLFPKDAVELPPVVLPLPETPAVKPAPSSDAPFNSKIDDVLSRLVRMEETLQGLTSDLIDPKDVRLSTVEEKFALDVFPPCGINRWFSKEALTLFLKLIRGNYTTTGDDTAFLYELETAGLIAIPRVPAGGFMDGVRVRGFRCLRGNIFGDCFVGTDCPLITSLIFRCPKDG